MNIEELRKIDKVVDRLAAQGPSGISPPHCWFCGKIEAWFRCDCKDAQDAQAGKRNRPRVVERDGKMLVILDPEVMAREHNQQRKRYAPPANTPANSVAAANAPPADPANKPDRKAYMRDLMRQRRAKQKEPG